MPAKFLPTIGVVDVDGRQRIGIGMQLAFARRALDETAELRRVVERAQGRGLRHNIVADTAL